MNYLYEPPFYFAYFVQLEIILWVRCLICLKLYYFEPDEMFINNMLCARSGFLFSVVLLLVSVGVLGSFFISGRWWWVATFSLVGFGALLANSYSIFLV